MRIVGITWNWDGDLYGILDVESSPEISPPPPPPPESGEQIINGGLEDLPIPDPGDPPIGWHEYFSNNNYEVVSDIIHSGTFALHIFYGSSYPGGLANKVTVPVAKIDISNFIVWVRGTGAQSGNISIQLIYSDGTFTNITLDNSDWFQVDLKSYMPDGKSFSEIRFLEGYSGNEMWVDDLSLIKT